MKKTTLFIFSIFASLVLFSQPVITNSYNFSIGDTYKYDGYDGVSNIVPGSGGTNQNWDFSQVTGTTYIPGEQNLCVDPSTTPFADSAGVDGSNICIKNIDDEVSPFQYLDCNNASQNLLALGFMAASNSSFGTYTDIQTGLEFPFSYLDTFNDTWEFLNFHLDYGYYFMRDSATVTVEADAYGTITTPHDQYQNTLRLKRTTTYYSWFRFSEGGEWIPSGPFTDIAYEWYAPSIKVPVMIIDEMDGFTDYGVRYLVDYNFTTSIDQNEQPELLVFPNPATDKLNLQSDREIETVSVYDLQGRLMNKNLNSATLNIDQYPKGTYMLNIEFADGTVVHKNIIKQ